MFLSAYLAVLLAAANASELTFDPQRKSINVAWSDVEDRIQGAITPLKPVVGQPFTVSVHVGSFEGRDFDGPVTMTLKPAGQMGSVDSVTVTRAPGEKTWAHRFTPAQTGMHTLELSFSTTRLKVARGALLVGEPLLPPWFGWVVGGIVVGAGLGIGVFLVLRRTPERGAVKADPPLPPEPR